MLRGAVFLASSLALICVGLLNIDGPLLTLGLLGLSLLVLSWIIGRRNLASLEISLKTPERVFADQAFDLHIHFINRRLFFDAFQLKLEFQLAGVAKIYTQARWVTARSSASVKLRGSIPNRGATSQHPYVLSSSFPLGLFKHQRVHPAHQEVLVFPKAITPHEFFSTGEFDESWEGRGLRQGDSTGEPRGIRRYRPGDPAKRLHWPSTIRSLARGRPPRVREIDPPGLRPRRATVIFHSYGTDRALMRVDHFERSLSLLCGTLRHLKNIGIPATLSADFLAWKSLPCFHAEAWRHILTCLAEASRTMDTEAHDVEAAIKLTSPDESLIIISDMPPESWTHTLSALGAIIIDIQQHSYKKKKLSFAR